MQTSVGGRNLIGCFCSTIRCQSLLAIVLGPSDSVIAKIEEWSLATSTNVGTVFDTPFSLERRSDVKTLNISYDVEDCIRLRYSYYIHVANGLLSK